MGDEKGKRLSENSKAIIADAYFEYRDRLMDYAERFGLGQEVVEDLVQDTFLAIVKSPEKYLNCENRMAWLVSILKNCMGHLRRETQYALQLREKLEQQFDQSHENEFSPETLYGGCIGKEDLELLVQYYVENHSYAELCARFGLENAACRKRVQRARERLRKALEEEGK